MRDYDVQLEDYHVQHNRIIKMLLEEWWLDD